MITPYLLYFFIYSFVGWSCESMYISIQNKKLLNSGFLKMPICPIYGFGSIFILVLLSPLKSYPILVFLLSMLVTSLLEYVTSYLMELAFHIKWWDYSKAPFNLNGRVCLFNSFLFGCMGIVILYLVHPLVEHLIAPFSSNTKQIIAFLLCIGLSIDTLHSTLKVLNFNKSILELEAKLSNLIEEGRERVGDEIETLLQNIIKREEHLRKHFPSNIHTLFVSTTNAWEEFKERINKKD